MSLIHWWPLNGDLKDQGVGHKDATQVGTTNFTLSGKIGKALTTSSANYLKIENGNAELAGFNNYTMSCWFYLTAKSTDHSASFISTGNWNAAGAQRTFGLYSWNTSLNCYTKVLIPNSTSWPEGISLSSDKYIYLNKWYHIVISFSNNSTKLYLNGEYIGSSNLGRKWTNTSEVNYYAIGRATYHGGFQLNGHINDVRIYDEALDEKQIKKIAQGLVLHYTMDGNAGKQPNLLSNSLVASNWTASLGTLTNDDGIKFTPTGGEDRIYHSVSNLWQKDQKYTVSFEARSEKTNLVTSLTAGGQTSIQNNSVVTSGVNADTYFTINLSETIVVGKKYIVSCYASGIPDDKYWCFPLGWQGNTTYPFKIYNGYNYMVFTANGTASNWGTKRLFMDDAGATARPVVHNAKIYDFYVGEAVECNMSRSIADFTQDFGLTNKWQRYTGTINCTATAEGGTLSFKVLQRNSTVHLRNVRLVKDNDNGIWSPDLDNKEFDISGYHYDGTKVNKPILSETSPRYQLSTRFGQSSTKNYIQNNFGLTNAQEMSLMAWVYPCARNTDRDRDCIIIGGVYLTIAQNGKISAYCYGKSPAGYNDGNAIVPLNNWSHIAIVYSTTKLSFYLNGVLDKEINCTGTMNSGYLNKYIGCEASSRQFNGNISDVRIYATALSADDIAEIYNQRKEGY